LFSLEKKCFHAETHTHTHTHIYSRIIWHSYMLLQQHAVHSSRINLTTPCTTVYNWVHSVWLVKLWRPASLVKYGMRVCKYAADAPTRSAVVCYTPFTRYNRLSNQSYNWFDNRLLLCKQTSNRFDNHVERTATVSCNRLSNPVWQPVVSCIQTFTRLSNWFNNRFDNRLYRVNGALGTDLGLQLHYGKTSAQLQIHIWPEAFKSTACCQ